MCFANPESMVRVLIVRVRVDYIVVMHVIVIAFSANVVVIHNRIMHSGGTRTGSIVSVMIVLVVCILRNIAVFAGVTAAIKKPEPPISSIAKLLIVAVDFHSTRCLLHRLTLEHAFSAP